MLHKKLRRTLQGKMHVEYMNDFFFYHFCHWFLKLTLDFPTRRDTSSLVYILKQKTQYQGWKIDGVSGILFTCLFIQHYNLSFSLVIFQIFHHIRL